MIRCFLFASAAALTAGSALACSDTTEVMAHFEKVKDAYIAKAPTMTPEQFPIWTGHLETFGDAMGKADFAGACAALDAASAELGFDVAPAVAAAPLPAPAQPEPPKPAETQVTELPAPQPQPAQEQPQPQPAQPQPQPAAAENGWKECPRGRCWVHRM